MVAWYASNYERVFRQDISSGHYFKSDKKGATEGLLQGRTGRIITTAGDLSLDIYEEIYASSGLIQLKKGILEYCGISSIQDSFIGPLYELDENDRKKWIVQVEDFATFDAI